MLFLDGFFPPYVEEIHFFTVFHNFLSKVPTNIALKIGCVSYLTQKIQRSHLDNVSLDFFESVTPLHRRKRMLDQETTSHGPSYGRHFARRRSLLTTQSFGSYF